MDKNISKIIRGNMLEGILEDYDIVEIIGKFVKLEKAGKNLKGLCPFHEEKTPSFIVSPSKQIFNCFGCHVGGNIIRFVMEYKKCTYEEAFLRLAEGL